MSLLDSLNPQQYDAATTIDGTMLILAGAGSGKTATLIARVAYMIEQGINPENILLLTFTNKAAKEMRDRAEKIVGPSAQKITASTFHSFCANLMRRYARLVGIPNDFTILDSPDTSDAMDLARQEFLEEQEKKGINYNLKKFPKTRMLLTLHETSINNLTSLDKVINWYYLGEFREEIKTIDKMFADYKRERGLVDYNDLLLYTVRVLQNNENIRESLDKTYEYISCDEYQDTNTIQNKILELLSVDFPNLAVVGDDNQSIYGWRSADIRNIINFEKNHPGCKVVTLFENYRSSQEILDLANAVMDNATEGIKKDLHGQFSFKAPEFIETANNFTEADFVCDKVEELHSMGVPYKEMAVMVRSARQSTVTETEFLKRGIPFKKFGGIKFLERSTVKDILAYLRVVVNYRDELAWFRILQNYSGIGKGYAKKIAKKINENGVSTLSASFTTKSFHKRMVELEAALEAHKNDTLEGFLKWVINKYYPEIVEEGINAIKTKSNVEKRDMIVSFRSELEEVRILTVLAEKYNNAEDFLADLVLEATVEEEVKDDYVNITTVHSAKGLEYEAVFFLDLVNGITPKCEEDADEEAEELRVFYVAITRAKKYLYLIVPKQFRLGPMIPQTECTRFLMHENVFDALGVDMPRSFSYDYSPFGDLPF